MIRTLAAEQKSEREIAARVRRSKTAVRNVLVLSARHPRVHSRQTRQLTAKKARAIVRRLDMAVIPPDSCATCIRRL